MKNSFWLPDLKIDLSSYLKISLEIKTKTMQLHISFIFKKDFNFLNLILKNDFLLTVAGWEERKKYGRKFGRLLFNKEWEFLDENFTVNATKHFQCTNDFSRFYL